VPKIQVELVYLTRDTISMQFSEQWLREWVNPKMDTTQLTDTLTLLGLEVDAITPVAAQFSGVVVGEVVKCEKHPNADRLNFCVVNIGEENPVEVVCGGQNVRTGLKVALIKVGGELPGNFTIKKSKLRGVESNGMICSASELGMPQEGEGILELAHDAPVGMDFRKYMQLEDCTIDVDLTPNRGDCASVQGIARELAAKLQLTLNTPKINSIKSQHHEKFPIEIIATKECPRYVGRIFRNINSKAITPLWMSERLRRSGLRCIHPVVDISNYVMLELGQPMHAFDLDKLHGKIRIRLAKNQEKITLLDNREVILNENILVVADDKQAQAVAGVIGGAESAVDMQTNNIFVESAFFNPTTIFKSTRQLNMSTDSAYRFERGVDYQLPALASERFTELLLEICGGESGPLVEVSDPNNLPIIAPILLRRTQIKKLLGIELADEKIISILTALDMRTTSVDQGWNVNPPSYRFDINIEADLIEELARMYGYDHIPATQPISELKIRSEKKSANFKLENLFKNLGYHEAITYSFVDPELNQLFDPHAETLGLANPLAKDISVMRTTLWPGLVQALQYNLNRKIDRVRMYETGLCFIQKQGKLSQIKRLAGIVAGKAHALQWGHTDRNVDFFDLKGDLEQLFEQLRLKSDLVWKKSEQIALHPGQSADLYLSDQCIGHIGALHPRLVKRLDLNVVPYVFELDLIKIDTIRHPKYKTISKFPAVYRDLAIVIEDSISAADIEKCVKRISGELLLEFRIFDVYHGKGIEFGKKSVALGLIFQDPSRTLVDEDVNAVMERIIHGLQNELNAKLRA